MCIGAGKNSATLLAFFSIENFRSKLAFADIAFATARPNDPYAGDWATISAQIVSLSHARNKIAHGRVIVFPDAPAGRRYVIGPRIPHASKKPPAEHLPPIGSLGVRDVYQVAKRCGMASNNLLNLYHKLGGGPWPFGEGVLQEPPHQTLAELKLLIHTILEPPSKSSRP